MARWLQFTRVNPICGSTAFFSDSSRLANTLSQDAGSRLAPTEADFERYRRNVLSSLERGDWSDETEQASRRALELLRERRPRALGASWWRSALTVSKTGSFVVAPLLVAERLMHAGYACAAVPLVVLSGMACYGAVAIVHDLAHGTFLPSRRANLLLGHLCAPLLLLEFTSFRRSHLEHHRMSQSVADPKRFGAAHASEANAPQYRTLDHVPWIFGKLVLLGASLRNLPVRARQLAYLLVSPVFCGPAVLFGSGEFSVFRRDFRRPAAWLALAESGLFAYWIGRHSPLLLGLAFAALIVGFNFVFYVFTTHLSPNQVYWTNPRRATVADALNVSDVRCGSLLRFLGNGFADHHSTHHLSAAIPCYRLAEAEDAVGPILAPFRAPVIDLLNARSCAFLFDNFFRAIVLTNAQAWDYAERGALRAVRRSQRPV